jgi:acetylglutamate kinase
LWYCFEQKGVFLDPQQPDIIIETLDYATYQSLKADKIVSEGMLPKLDNCFAALRQKVHNVHIGNIDMLKGMSSHTTIQLNA